jgi:dihydroflavonol-4-reductase
VLDAAALDRALAGCDAVFHLAAVYSFARSDAARMRAVNVEGTRLLLDRAARGAPARRRIVHTSSCATCGPVPGRAATEADAPPGRELRVPYKATKLAGERLALDAARTGLEVVVVNPTTPVGAGDRRPTPTGKMVADVVAGRARAHLRGGVLNVVAVEDVAVGHVRALERGRAGERYLLGGENMAMRDVFAHVAAAAGRPAPHAAVPWSAALAAAVVADAAARARRREPRLLVLDEVRLARRPMAFDDGRARRELGHRSRAAASALAAAARAALAG